MTQFAKAIDELKQTKLDMSELADRDAQALRELAESKQKNDEDVIHQRGLEEADAEATEGSAQIIDLMEVLRKSLSKNAVVSARRWRQRADLAGRTARGEEEKGAGETQNGTEARAPRLNIAVPHASSRFL